MKNSTPEQLPIIDGFMYNPLLRYLPQRFLPLAYENLNEYRTGPWQPRFYTVPAGNGGAVINAGVTIAQQIRMAVSGSVLIGYTMATLTSTAGSFGVVILDADADVSGTGTSSFGGYPFTNGIDRFILGNAFDPGSLTGQLGASGQRFILLTTPYQIVSNLLTVKLSNHSAVNNVRVQLLLYVMEPCTE